LALCSALRCDQRQRSPQHAQPMIGLIRFRDYPDHSRVPKSHVNISQQLSAPAEIVIINICPQLSEMFRRQWKMHGLFSGSVHDPNCGPQFTTKG